MDWERRFSDLKEILMIYALAHRFVSQVVEGDELYTKVKRIFLGTDFNDPENHLRGLVLQ